MRKLFLASSALAASVMMVDIGLAGTLIPVVPPPGSTYTAVFGINDNDVIVGSRFDSAGVEHGFFGTLDGNYTPIEVTGQPDVIGTEPRGINNEGFIAGTAYANGFCFGYEFLRKPNGMIGLFKNDDGVPLDGTAQGITVNAQSSGDYFTNGCANRTGYYAKGGNYKHDLKLSVDAPIVRVRGINKSLTYSGAFNDSAGVLHGFLLQNGVTKVIDYPSKKSVGSGFQAINDKGLVTGGWSDADGGNHPFTYDSSSGTFTPFTPKELTGFVTLWGLNNSGLLAVQTDAGISYIYCPRKKSRCPKGGSATVGVKPSLAASPRISP